MKWDSDDPVSTSKYGAFQANNSVFFLTILGMLSIHMEYYIPAAFCFGGGIVFFSLSYAYSTDGLNRTVWDRFLGDDL